MGASPHGDRCGREQDEAGEEDPAGAEAVAEGPGHEQQRGEDQRVGVDHPFEAGDIRGKADAERVESDVDDADVEQDDDEAEGGADQRQPRSGSVGRGHRDNPDNRSCPENARARSMRKFGIYANDPGDFAQMADWEDIRHFLAVAQSGTLSGAARSLRVDHATVSRRLAALEAALDVRLVDRLPRSCRLTAIGRQVLEQALAMEAGAHGIARLAKAAHAPLVGRVGLSAPPVLVTHVLAGQLTRFRAAYPDIRLSLSAEAQQVSLSRREADVALRLVRPNEAGSVTRKLGTMAFGLYAHRAYAHLDAPEKWQFIAYDQHFADMPQQSWLLGIAGERRWSAN